VIATPAKPGAFILFVNGTLMRGLALHANLDGATFIREADTAPCYRLYSIDDIHPGMCEVSEGGVSVSGELYHVPWDVWQRVEAGEPPNLYRGSVKLSDGTEEWGPLSRVGETQRRDGRVGHFVSARVDIAGPPRYFRLCKLARIPK
jgi:gamma-glutamylcyclotransferase (GGCT)/AIG2-like uncharacterized protein YtfP